jgi:hypothetical protein
MAISNARTVRYLPPPEGATVANPLIWPAKRPLDYEDFSLDLTMYCFDAGDTLAAASTQQSGLLAGNPVISGYTVTVMLAGGLGGTLYTVDVIATTVGGRQIDVPVQIYVLPGGPAFPTSPLLLPPGQYWYSAFSNTFQAAPVWGALPRYQPTDVTAFWINGGELTISPATTLIPAFATGLAAGAIWCDGGVVIANGNPGLPTSAGATGTLYYNNGPIGISP